MPIHLHQNWEEHFVESQEAILAALKDAVLTPQDSPTEWSVEYIYALSVHLDALLVLKAKLSGRDYVVHSDMTEQQDKRQQQIKHYLKILEALYSRKPKVVPQGECPDPRLHEEK